MALMFGTFSSFPRDLLATHGLFLGTRAQWCVQRIIFRANFVTDCRVLWSRNDSRNDMSCFQGVRGKYLRNHKRSVIYREKHWESLPRLLRTPRPWLSHQTSRNIRINRVLSGREPWMISDGEVNSIIGEAETSRSINCGIIDRYETNQLASNQPIEDRKFVTKLLHEEGGYLFGVLDGHGGDSCAHSVSQRLSDYIALGLLPLEVLKECSSIPKLIEYLCMTSSEHNDNIYMDNPACQQSLHNFFHALRQRYTESTGHGVVKPTYSRKHVGRGLYASLADLRDEKLSHKINGITSAFLTLDADLSAEALAFDADDQIDKQSFAAANSGACALIAHVNGTELSIANIGDCRAVLGVENEDSSWSALQLSSDHTAGNQEEVQRIVSQHPIEEAATCIRYERLLQRLAPLRAFGDLRFKWDLKTQQKIFNQLSLKLFTEEEIYFTPPYLTAKPEVTSYQLQKSDKFLVLASDGLWDMLSNEEVVHLVKDHINRKEGTHVNGNSYDISYREQELPCELTNSASCLIREALGGDDHVAVSTSLSIPHPDVRMYRDDITVIVVFFDWDALEISSENEQEYSII